MISSTFAVCLVATTASAVVSAEKNIKHVNHCPYDIYSWTVGPAGSEWTGHDHEAITIPANTVTYQGMANCELTHGTISVKLRDLPRYEIAPAGIVQMEYNLVPSKNHLWYGLSAIDCNHNVGPEDPYFCPLVGGGMKVYVEHAGEGKCPPAWCDTDGQCHNIYEEQGQWQGETNFRCDAGKDIVIEFCTERTGPRTFNGYDEPGHHELQPEKKPGNTTTNGVCGAKTPGGETCFGFAHGDCCSQYGWCGFSDAHCGTDCQSGFGNCTSDLDAKPSYQSSAYISSYSSPLVQLGEPSSNYATPSISESIPAYSKPTSSYEMPSSSYNPPGSSYTPPTLTESKYTSTYSVPAYSSPPNYLPPWNTPSFRTIYATNTVTETRPYVTKTVTVSVSNKYQAPSSSTPEYDEPSYTNTPQQEHVIPSTWYNRPSTSSQYYEPLASEYGAEPPQYTEPVYYPPA
ncbi:hypothetical protein N0V86_002749 [Didymella sp. IMI 355093]|nr:hypothetical protein N0V86_002749 [Didymella sp. IMI 355093]